MCARARIVFFVLREVDFERVLGDVVLVGKREADHLCFHGDISVEAGPLQQTRAEIYTFLLVVQLRIGPSTQIDARLQRVVVVVRHGWEEALLHCALGQIARKLDEHNARIGSHGRLASGSCSC